MSEQQACTVRTRDDGEGPPRGDGDETFDAVEGLARLMSASALYPPGHPRIVDIAEPVLATVRAASADAPFVISGSRPDAEDGEPQFGSAAGLRRDLDALGIARIEVCRDATPEDLVAFAHFLRQQVGGRPGSGLRHADLSTLPKTIRVLERQFDESSFRADEVDEEADGIDGAPAAGRTSAPADAATVALFRRAIVDMLANRGDLPVDLDESWAGAADRHEAIRAVAEAVRVWIERRTAGSIRTATAAEILTAAEHELPEMVPGVEWKFVLQGIGRSIDAFLRDRFRKESRADFDVKTATSTESEDSQVSEEELSRAVLEVTAGAQPFDVATPVDPGERLTILLNMLGDAGSRAATEGTLRRLGECLSAPLGPRERGVLVGWLQDVCRAAAPADLDRRLCAVTGALRTLRRSAVAELLLDACAAPRRDAAEPLWPHLAYELVTYDEDSAESRKEELQSLVVTVPKSRMHDEAQRLVAIVARAAEPVATSVFMPPRAALFPLYEILIDTPRRAGFAVVVTAAFKRHPPRRPEAGALVALAPTDDRARRLVARLLREGDSKSPALRAFAVEILVETLRRLPPTRRDEVWVETAIRALGKLPCAASAEMVREVLGSRRFIFHSAWPDFARRAAAEAAAWAAA